MVVMSPSGDVAMQQRDLILWATGLMLIVIVPVIIMTLMFAWRYRASNRDAEYSPDWDHSTMLELVIWAVPLLIIIALGAITWVSTHKLDPYRPLDRIDASRPVPEGTEPLVVQVVSLEWKWLFFYPEQGIATVNELAAPVDRPIRFEITSHSNMNSFYIPALAGQIWGSSSKGPEETRMKEIGLDLDNPRVRQTIELIREIIGFPRHLSQHVGGFVITQGRLDALYEYMGWTTAAPVTT